MTVMLTVLSALALLELLQYAKPFWQFRTVGAVIIAFGTALLAGALFMVRTNGWSYVALAIALYRCFNLLRIADGIGAPAYLRRSGRRTSVVLMIAYGLALAGWYLSLQFNGTGFQGWEMVAGLQFLTAVTILCTTKRSRSHTLPASLDRSLSDHDLPSITVAIPARNETESLRQCLEALVACDYPKLEILVIDDCSQDRTSEIIEGFAHGGVRFLKGTEAPAGWLAKNWAYDQLSEAANGKLLVFCGVDIVFGRDTLRTMVATLLMKRKRMLCVMPRNDSGSEPVWRAGLLQPMRYAWEISLPRRLFNRPPVLSSCWIAERQLIKQAGGFAAIKSSVSPESHFARQALPEDGYSFVRSAGDLDVTAAKTFDDQLDTAIRTRYPQLHRRPELVLALGLLELLLVVAPLPLAITGLITGHWLIGGLSGLAFGIFSWSYTLVIRTTYKQHFVIAWLMLIPAVLTDLALRNYSMYQYEFSEVLWKGRNVCLPVMQVIPRLPKL